eukprot:1853323-Rhodomonas_salina.1
MISRDSVRLLISPTMIIRLLSSRSKSDGVIVEVQGLVVRREADLASAWENTSGVVSEILVEVIGVNQPSLPI